LITLRSFRLLWIWHLGFWLPLWFRWWWDCYCWDQKHNIFNHSTLYHSWFGYFIVPQFSGALFVFSTPYQRSKTETCTFNQDELPTFGQWYFSPDAGRFTNPL